MSLQRILLVVHHYPPRRVGGAELLARRQAQWLARHDIDVQVLCIENISHGSASSVSVLDEMDDRVRVRRLNLSLAPGQELRLWYDEPALRARCESLLDEFQPDLLHLVSGYLFGAAPLHAAYARRIPS